MNTNKPCHHSDWSSKFETTPCPKCFPPATHSGNAAGDGSSPSAWYAKLTDRDVPDEKAEALRAVFKLIEDGDLVRNIENDHDTMLYLKQGLRITSALANAQAILASAFGGNVRDEPPLAARKGIE